MASKIITTFTENEYDGRNFPIMGVAHELDKPVIDQEISGIEGYKILPGINQGDIIVRIMEPFNHPRYEDTSFTITKNGLIHLTSDLDRNDPELLNIENDIVSKIRNVMDKEIAIDDRINKAPVVAGVNMETLSWFAIKNLESMRDENGEFRYGDVYATPLSTTFKDAYKDEIFTVRAGVRENSEMQTVEPYFEVVYSEKYGGKTFEISGQELNQTLDLMRDGRWHEDSAVKSMLLDALMIENMGFTYDELDKMGVNDNVVTEDAIYSSSYEFFHSGDNAPEIKKYEDIPKEYAHSVYGKEISDNPEISTSQISSRYIKEAIEQGFMMERSAKEIEITDKIFATAVKDRDMLDRPEDTLDRPEDHKLFGIEEQKNGKIEGYAIQYNPIWEKYKEFTNQKNKIMSQFEKDKDDIYQRFKNYEEKSETRKSEINLSYRDDKEKEKALHAVDESLEKAKEYVEKNIEKLELKRNIALNERLSEAGKYVQAIERFRRNIDRFMNSMIDLSRRCVSLPKDFVVGLMGNIYKYTINPLITSGLNLCKEAAHLGVEKLTDINIARKQALELAKASQAIMDWDKNQSQALEEVIYGKMNNYVFEADMNDQCDVSNFDARLRNMSSLFYNGLVSEYTALAEYETKKAEKSELDMYKVSEIEQARYDGTYGDTIRSRMYFTQGVAEDFKNYLNTVFRSEDGLDITKEKIKDELGKIIDDNLNKKLLRLDDLDKDQINTDDPTLSKAIKDFMPDVLKSPVILDKFKDAIIESTPIITGRLEANETLANKIEQINARANSINKVIDHSVESVKGALNIEPKDKDEDYLI